jgi:FlaA1/EpsC-like NDP-sugar epimerase
MEKHSHTLLYKLSKVQYINRWIVFFIDILLSIAATFATLALLHMIYGEILYPLDKVFVYVLIAIPTSAISFWLFGTYKGIIRHSSISEAGRLGYAAFFSSAIILVLAFFCISGLTGHMLFYQAILNVVFTAGVLIFTRVFINSVYSYAIRSVNCDGKRTLIFITDEERLPIMQPAFRSNNYQMAGYLRVGDRKRMRIEGNPVYSVNNEESFITLIENFDIKILLFISRRDVEHERERIIRYCERAHVEMLILPPVDELKKDGVIHATLPKIKIEDLLGREEIYLDKDIMHKEFAGKVVLVTGAAGSIGSELCRQLARMDVKLLVLFDNGETPLHNIRLELEEHFPDLNFVPVIGDVRVKARLNKIFDLYKPQIVFHAAAYKHVPLMEENPCESVLVNVVGTRQVADACVEFGVEKMIMISTDKAVNPTSVMGCCKRIAEIYCQSLGMAIANGKVKGITKFVTTRFGNVLGSNGSVIPLFKHQIEEGGPVTVTDPNIIRFFMTIPEACRLVMEAATIGKGSEIFVFDMGEPVKIVDLATRMIELAGYKPYEDILIKFTGLRPGEKLYEEVLSNEENTIPTGNKKIKIAKVREYNYEDVLDTYSKIKNLSLDVDVISTVKLMKEMVPEYKSNHSVYEKLDK